MLILDKFMIIIKQKWSKLANYDHEHVRDFLTKEVKNSHLDNALSDARKTLDASYKRNSERTTKKNMLPYLKQYHVDVLKSAEDVIMQKSKVADAILVNILKSVMEKKSVNEALLIIRAECLKNGIWNSIYPAIRDVFLGFDHHLEALIKIGQIYPEAQLAHFIPFVLPEILTKLKSMSKSMVQNYLKPVAANIITDMREQYDRIAEDYDRIVAGVSRSSTKKNSNKNDPGRGIKKPPVILSKPTSIRIRFTASKPSGATPNTKVIDHLKFEDIVTKIIGTYNQMMDILNLSNKESTEKQMTIEECLAIVKLLERFTDDVNKIGTKWMEILYVSILSLLPTTNPTFTLMGY